MRKIKKAVVLLLSVAMILAFANFTLASTIQPKNISGDNTSSEENTTDNETENTTGNATENTAENKTENATNNTSNAANKTSGLNTSNSASNRSTIATTNSSEGIPHTGSEDSLNLALFLLLAVVLGMFSLVQYRRIAKKDE